MIKRLSNSKWLIIRHGVSVVVVFAMLVVALVAISPDLSFGWFAKNNTVSANGMAVQANRNKLSVYYQLPTTAANGTLSWEGSPWIKIEGSAEDGFDTTELLGAISAPGDIATFRIKVENVYTSNYNTTITGFGFAAPSGTKEEYPVWSKNGETSVAHFLSTELYTCLHSVTYNEGQTVKSYSPGNAIEDWSPFRTGNTSHEINFLNEGERFGLPKGGEVIFELKVGFLNRTDKNQNIFKNFGDAENGNTGVFARRFFFTFGDS